MSLEKQLADTDSVYCTKVTNSNQSSIFLCNLGDAELEVLFGADYKSDDKVRLRLDKRNLAFNAVAHAIDGKVWYKRKTNERWTIDSEWLSARLSALEKAFADNHEVFIASLNKDDHSTHRLYLKGMTSLTREDGSQSIALRDFLFSGDVIILTKLDNGDVSFEIKIPDNPIIAFDTKRNASVDSTASYQLITYGAPGTGKSFNIDKIVNDKGCVHFRTTFHPDSDYASFVGCYKPIVREYDRIATVGKKIENAELDAAVPDELRKERKIEYTFVEQTFTKAYVAAGKNKASAIANGGQAAEPVYLIIEEINRGNCAQVFGDIFQLLDREGGFSKYPICADDDLHRHLESVFKGLDFGSQYAKVQTGEELVLPDNLYIWATMNTSDQSLFPMDSAFKRRWDWEYVPISEGVDENTKQKLDWNIVVKDVEKQPDGTEKEVTVLYSWWQFLQIINTKIYHLTDSEDKELGYFFAKPDSAEGISAKLFVNKVVFYLWTDVYKNYGVDNIFKGSDNGATTEEEKAKGVPFRQFFDETGKNANTGTLKNFFKAIGLKSFLPTA